MWFERAKPKQMRPQGRIFQAYPASEEFSWHEALLENGRLWQAPRNFLSYEKRALGTGEIADKADLRKSLKVEFFPGKLVT